MVFSEVVGTLSFLQPQSDDDMADRLHYYYTTTFLLVTSVLISLKMYGGRPIECWMPAEYQSSWQEYTEIYCFSMNTYFTPFGKQIPLENEEREQNMISYYQWTPFFLVTCAMLFYSPCLVWRVLYTKSGLSLKDIVAFATDRSNIQPKMREANMKGISAHLGSVFRHRFRWGSSHQYQHRFLRLLNLRFYEAYLTMLYIGIKILYMINVSVQIYLMNWWHLDLFQGRPWSDSGNFPRVTYCDMDIRILGNVQKHTVQCVLVINIFTEKVFVMLWMWYIFIFLVTLTSLINWLMSSLPFDARKKFIARRLELADVEFKRVNFEKELEVFVSEYIKMDGVFVLRMLTIHAGILVCTEIVDEMWEDYVRQNAEKFTKSPTRLTPGTGSPDQQPLLGSKRKISVLVPLVSARGNTIVPSTPPRPATALPYSAAGLAAASHFLGHGQTHREGYLKTPSAQQWKSQRRARMSTVERAGGGTQRIGARFPTRSISSTLTGMAAATTALSALHSTHQQPPPIVIEGSSNESDDRPQDHSADASAAEESGNEEAHHRSGGMSWLNIPEDDTATPKAEP
ncbi:innexin domain-containing protein [Ditylenchus destructor]|nr:innexin domain-containing protein [Ditylenchus destructor]